MILRITLFSGSGQLWRLDTSNLVWELFINWLFDPILLMLIILPIHCPLKGPECRGCNNTRTDTLTFLWNPSQSFFFEHFSTKTPLLAFKLLLTFHGFEQTTGEIIKIFVTMSYPLKLGHRHIWAKCQGRCHQYFSISIPSSSEMVTITSHHHRTEKYFIYDGNIFLVVWFAQTFFILISPLILLNSRHTHNVIFICWKLLKFVLV